MIKESKNEYLPETVPPPGETLLETLESLEMTQVELAERMGRPKKTINEIIRGKAPITSETALQLERVLRIPARFWNNLERQYREGIARHNEQIVLSKCVKWLESIPVRAMTRLGWISSKTDKVAQLKEVLNFFGVASPEQWKDIWSCPAASFRKSPAFQSDPGAVAAWLRMGELGAYAVDCEPYDEDTFKSTLYEIRSLTMHSPDKFVPKISEWCAAAGVAVVFVPELPKTRVCGATRWMSSDKGLIQLSLRYKSDDHLWFTFFHEAGHILKHGKRDVFLEEGGERDVKEDEADKFAAEFLVPSDRLRQFLQTHSSRISKRAISQFAGTIGVSPGIVVGRLQHAHVLPYSHCNGLKMRFEWGGT